MPYQGFYRNAAVCCCGKTVGQGRNKYNQCNCADVIETRLYAIFLSFLRIYAGGD